MNVIVDDLLLNYQISGKGKLVLLIHGWGDTLTTFADLQRALSDQYQVLSMDLPGFGGSQAPKSAWDLDNYAQFVSKAINKLNLSQPYALIGHSNGGALSLRAVSLKLLNPQKLVLIASSGIRANNRLKRFNLKIIAKTGNLATIWMPERYRQALRKSLYGAAGSDMLVAPHLQETFKKTVSQDLQADATSILVPTLLIYAVNDKAVPLTDGQKYQQLIRGSRLEIIDKSSHFIHHDQPEQVQKLIKEFLS